MKSLRLLVFDISGEYGHFRKFNTTSSPLTYAIPTRTALIGVLGVILGIEREQPSVVFPEGVKPLIEQFGRAETRFAIQVLNPIKKVNIGFNLLDTGKSHSSFFNIQNRTQIEFELLKNPKFRIYFYHSDIEILGELAERIFEKKHHFTPYLGLSQFTALIEPVEIETITAFESKDFQKVVSCANLSLLQSENSVRFEENNFYTTDTFPTDMKKDRVITEYAEILIERNGNPLEIRAEKFWKTSFGNILFL